MIECGYPVYGANGVIGHYPEYNHVDETILVGCRGTCGEVTICEPKSYVTSNAMCLDDLSDSFDMNFVASFLKAYDFQKIIGGTSQPQITKAGISSIELPVFSLEEQRMITANLQAVLDQIDKCNSQIAQLDQLVKSRFVEMFEDGANPTVKLASLTVSMRNGLSPSKGGRHHARVLTLSAITQGTFDATAWKEGVFAMEPLADKRVSNEDFYVCRGNGNKQLVGTGDYSAVALNDLVFPDTVIAVKINQDQVIMPFLKYAWARPSVRKQIESSAKTTNGTFKINQTALSNIEVPLPPLALQQDFAAFAAQVDKTRAIAQQQIDKLQMLYDSLAQEYFA